MLCVCVLSIIYTHNNNKQYNNIRLSYLIRLCSLFVYTSIHLYTYTYHGERFLHTDRHTHSVYRMRRTKQQQKITAPTRVETSLLDRTIQTLLKNWATKNKEDTIRTFLRSGQDALRELETKLESAGEDSQLSLSQLRVIYTTVELLMLWGVYGANDLTGSFVPRRNASSSFHTSLSKQIAYKRCESSDEITSVLEFCTFIISFLQRPHFVMMLPRYLRDVLAVTLHLSLTIKAAAQQLNKLLQSLPQQLRMETLLSIMTTTTMHPSTKQFRARLGTILSHELQQNGAVVIVVGFFLGHISSKNTKGSEGESRVARLIATPALQNHSRDSYFSKIAPQILAILRTARIKDEKTPFYSQIDLHVRVSVLVIEHVASRWPEMSEKHFMTPLTHYITMWGTQDRIETTSIDMEKEIETCLDRLIILVNAVTVITPKLYAVLLNHGRLASLFHMCCRARRTRSYLKSKCDSLLRVIFRDMSEMSTHFTF